VVCALVKSYAASHYLTSSCRRAAVITNWILAKTLNETRSDTVAGKEYYLRDHLAADSFYRDPRPDSIAVSPYGSAQTTVDAYNPGLPGPLSTLRTEMNASKSDLTLGGTDMDPGKVNHTNNGKVTRRD
jgi:hypothetical protein